MLLCEFCNKECKNKNSYTQHSIRCNLNPNKIIVKRSPNAGARKGCIPYNKGKKMSTEQKLKISISVKNNPNCTGRAHTIEKEQLRISKIKSKALLNNGGYRKGSGRGKQGWYKGIYCDSSWELAFVIFHLDNNIKIERYSGIRKYIFENKERNYYPDFIVNNVIYEIKGFETEQSKAKLLHNNDITLIDKISIKPYLEYVINKYGKDFIKLYGG